MARAMVGAAVHKVNKNREAGHGKPARKGPVIGHAALYQMHCVRQTCFPSSPDRGAVVYLLIVVFAAALLLLVAWLRERRLRQRENMIRALLDGADTLEAQLQECRSRLQSLREMLVALPEEMSERANTALSADDKVDAALRDLLAHRLWIQQNAATATLQELEAARVALAQSGTTLQAQLDRLAAISDDLQRARANAQTITPPST